MPEFYHPHFDAKVAPTEALSFSIATNLGAARTAAFI